jgi:hypothetical protein
MTPSFDTLRAFPHDALTRVRNQPLRARNAFGRHMERGAAFHAAGLADYALAEFEHALSLQPGDAQAASARATVLLEQRRPQAARQTLLACAQTLSANADGCCNLALAHAIGGDAEAARQMYERALNLAPAHAGALEGLVREAGARRDWDAALIHAEAAARAHPSRPATWLLWIDTLLHARRPHDALAVIDGQSAQAAGGQPQAPVTSAAHGVRRALAQALIGQWDQARATLVGLPAGHGPGALALLQAGLLPSLGIGRGAARGVDVMLWCAQYAAAGVAEGHWHCASTLSQMLQAASRADAPATSPALWQIARPQLDSLPLPDSTLAACLARADAADLAARPANDSLAPPLPRSDGRLRIALLIPPLDAMRVHWLAHQLASHHPGRFDLRAYAALNPDSADPAEAAALAALSSRVDQLLPIGHLSDAELVARIRLDQPDLLIDLSASHPAGRPAVSARRLASVHARLHAVPAHVADAPYDYLITDLFTHAGTPPAAGGAWARVPGSTWLVPAPASTAGWQDEPSDASSVRLTAWVAATCIDEQSFALWMRLLRQLDGAVLELLALPPDTQARLRREAARHDVAPARLWFGDPSAAPEGRRIHLDPLLRSDPIAVSNALVRGEVVLACAGQRTASRPGAAILHGAGMPQWVASDPEALFTLASHLATDAVALRGMRAELSQARIEGLADPASPGWWNSRARAAELGWAFTHMVERARAGLPPASFEVPCGAVPTPLSLRPAAP